MKSSLRRMMAAIICLTPLPAMAQDGTLVAGMSKARIERVRAKAQEFVDQQKIAGAVVAVHRRGQLVDMQTVGWQDKEANIPMRRDTIFRLASMTKPIGAVAVLLLIDDGVISMEDPIDKWLPELANRQVLLDIDGPLDRTRPAARPITVRDVLTWQTGYGITLGAQDSPINKAMASMFSPMNSQGTPQTTDAWLAALGKLPLKADPGAQWVYNTSSDIGGALVERASGMTLDRFLQTRLFGPLKMNDTGFWVPPEKRNRLAKSYFIDRTSGKLTPAPDWPGADAPPIRFSAAGGLVSTADDYLRFARMLLNGGALDGVRILSPALVKAMMTDQQVETFHNLRDWAGGLPLPLQMLDRGMGYGGGVYKRSAGLGPAAGSYGWPGAAGVWWTVDPQNELITMVMIQQFDQDVWTKVGVDVTAMVYGSIID